MSAKNVHKLTRSEQSRINGAKSKGPISIEGKARSSQNAIKHGFAAVINVVLQIEDKPAFDRHVDGFRASFKPRDYTETTLVEQLAAINWRQSRLVGLETALIDSQMSFQHAHVCAISPESAQNPYFHLVQAWQALVRAPQPRSADQQKDPSLPPDGYDLNSLELIRRYQVSLDRQFRNALLNLRQYRKDFASTEATETTQESTEPNEPATPSIGLIPTPHKAAANVWKYEEEAKIADPGNESNYEYRSVDPITHNPFAKIR